MLCHLDHIEDSFISHYHQLIYLTAEMRPSSLIDALSQKLPHIPQDSWTSRLAWGGAFVNGIETSTDQELPLPCRIEYYEPRFKLEEAADFFPRFSEDHILYQDEDLLCVFKPAGLPCVPAREQKYFNLKVYLQNYLGTTLHMPSRLDLSTAGIVLVSKAARAHRGLQKFYEQRRINKYYLLDTAASIDWDQKQVVQNIGRDPGHPVLRMPVIEGGKPAETVFTKITPATASNSTFIQAKPLSGRTHQIRVHAAYNGFPIVGDRFYGGAPAEELHLLSYRLNLSHPIGGKALTITLPERLWPAWAIPALSQLD